MRVPAIPVERLGRRLGQRRLDSGPVEGAIIWFIVGGAVLGLAVVTRPTLTPVNLVPILVALGALCVIELTRRPAPNLAWLAAIGGAYAAASLPIDQARAADPGTVGVGTWLTWAVPASAGALITMWIAAGYATRSGRRLDPVAVPIAIALFGWFAVAIATTIAAIAAGQGADPAFTWIDIATAPIATFSLFVLALAGLGVAADIRAAAERARAERAKEQVPPGDRASGAPGWGWDLARATIRELIPGQSAAEEANVAAERTRLAGDLHASVLPGLRRAIAEAEAGGDPDVLASQLRSVDLELERLMANRWPVVLEAFGLVAALEDLAERIETDTGRAVQIDVDRAGDRPPPAIERTAWRIAELAIDNATRHAEAPDITVRVAVERNRVSLAVADDGRGFDPTTPGSVRTGARGLADATRRAMAVGATIRIESRPGGGTTVVFEWVARRA
jgi:signal transduction histidine kinase